jgi:hypothetical protein
MYELLTRGSVDVRDPTHPVPVPGQPDEEGHDWYARVAPLRSAYKEMDGNEPNFTNFAQVPL